MKGIFTLLLFLLTLSSSLFSQTNTSVKKIQYSFQISDATEDKLQQLTEKLNSIPNISNCKYHFKPEKSAGELIFVAEEKPVQSEHDTANELPNVKSMIMETGMRYEGVNIHEIPNGN